MLASQVASTSAIPYPDDSDFIESDAEGEECEIEEGGYLAPSSGVARSSRAVSPSSTAGIEESIAPEIPLIYISNRLYFTFFSDPPSPSFLNKDNGTASAWFEEPKQQRGSHAATSAYEIPDDLFWFNIDEDLVYLSFFEDWGPLNVALFYRFCMHVHQLLNDETYASKSFVFYTSNHPHRKANASLLAAMYSMIIDRIEPADAFHPFSQIEFKPFRDAGYGRADYCLTIQDVLYGVHRAIKEKLLDLSEFNLDEYEYYEQVQCGDWNWITPQFLAFASPNDREYVAALKAAGDRPPKDGFRLGRKLPQVFTNTIKYFKERNVKLVVRLNNPLYDKTVFEDVGIAHLDLYFDDGSNPSEPILREFIRRADEVIRRGGAVAVHCKAGLGRTGVLIGAYLVWRYGFCASEVIGFMRIMRPGCVVGPQQHFMYQNFVEWVRWSVRDQAMAAAQKVIEAEKQKMLAAGLSIGERTAKKRASSSDLEEEIEIEETVDAPPVTPKARKPAHVIPATAAPAVKPVPCVGQPRKSPSPSRKRPAVAVPAAIAPASMQSSKPAREVLKPSSSISTNELHRSASEENVRTSVQGKTPSQRVEQGFSVASSSIDSLRNSWEELAARASATPPSRNNASSDGLLDRTTPRSGRVLTEAQRICNGTPRQDAGTPSRRNGKSCPESSASKVKEVSATATTSLPAPIRPGSTPKSSPQLPGHQRSRSEAPAGSPSQEDIVDDVFGSSPQPSTPSGKSRVPSFKASPHVRAAYNLKDSKLPHPRSPRAELGVLSPGAPGVIAESSSLPKAQTNAENHSEQKSLESTRQTSAVSQAHMPRAAGRTPSSNNSISPAKVRGNTMTTGSTTRAAVVSTSGRNMPANGARSIVRTTSNGSTGSSGRPTSYVTATSSKNTAATQGAALHGRHAGTRQPSNGSKSGQLSNVTRPVSRLTGATASNANMSKTTPISNSANAAMLAARANLKRARPSPDVPQTGFVHGADNSLASKPPLSSSAMQQVNGAASSSRFGRNVRRRRSSLSSADIGMA